MSMVRVFSGALLLVSLFASASSQAGDPIMFLRHQMRLDSDFSKCWDFAEGNTSNNVTLQVWGCQTNKQQWVAWVYPWTPGSQQIMVNFQSVSNGTCISVENNSLANGARIVQRACDMNDPSQQWIRLTRDPYLDNRSKYMNVRSGKCMDAPYSSNGTVLQQWTCASASYWPQQMFRAVMIPTGAP